MVEIGATPILWHIMPAFGDWSFDGGAPDRVIAVGSGRVGKSSPYQVRRLPLLSLP
jgi:hypothetical protein